MIALGYNFWTEWDLREKVDFDGKNRLIIVYPHVTTLDIREDVWSAWVRWHDMFARGYDRYPLAMERKGLEEIPGGETGDLYFLRNGWRLVLDFSRVAVTGVLYSRDFASAYFTSDLIVQHAAQVSALVNTVTSSALTQSDSDHLASIPSNPVLATDARLDNLDAPVSTSGLTSQQATMLLELYRIMGLDPTKPLVVDENNSLRTAGVEIDQTVVTDNGVTTVTRQ